MNDTMTALVTMFREARRKARIARLERLQQAERENRLRAKARAKELQSERERLERE